MPMLDSSDLRPRDLAVLDLLADGRRRTTGEIADHLWGGERQKAAGSCSMLRRRGFVQEWAGDYKQWSLTDAGMALARMRRHG